MLDTSPQREGWRRWYVLCSHALSCCAFVARIVVRNPNLGTSSSTSTKKATLANAPASSAKPTPSYPLVSPTSPTAPPSNSTAPGVRTSTTRNLPATPTSMARILAPPSQISYSRCIRRWCRRKVRRGIVPKFLGSRCMLVRRWRGGRMRGGWRCVGD